MKNELLWTKALETSKKAINDRAIIPIQTELVPQNNNHFELRRLSSQLPNYLINYGPNPNPFRPWDKRLEISRINKTHALILNKYPVENGHMLLITNGWKPQDGWLNIKDFDALYEVDKDTSGLWFFNSSFSAGASQPHRHIQLLRRSNSMKICPREQWIESFLYQKDKMGNQLSRSISVVKRDPDKENSGHHLYECYLELTSGMKLGDNNIDSSPRVPYNLLISRKWMVLIRRLKERTKGFSINALGFAGYFLATKQTNINFILTNGPESLLNDVVNPK